MFKVKAIIQGYYNHQIMKPGKKFIIRHAKDFSYEWMTSLDLALNDELKKLKAKDKSVAVGVKTPAATKVEIIRNPRPAPAKREALPKPDSALDPENEHLRGEQMIPEIEQDDETDLGEESDLDEDELDDQEHDDESSPL